MQNLQEIIKRGSGPGFTFVNDPGTPIALHSWTEVRNYLGSGELKKLEFQERMKSESFLLIILYIGYHSYKTPEIESMFADYNVNDSSIKAIWENAVKSVNLQIRPSLNSTKEWTLGIAFELEKIRHCNLKEKGFYNSASSLKKPELAAYLSSSYFAILEFQDLSPEIAFIKVLSKYLKTTKDQESLGKILVIVRSHALLDGSCAQLEIMQTLRDIIAGSLTLETKIDSSIALIAYSLSQVLLKSDGPEIVKFSRALLNPTVKLDISELLRILQIFYYVTDTKAQNFEQAIQYMQLGKCLTHIASGAWMDENDSPQFLKDLLDGTNRDGERCAFALTGIIRALQNRRDKHQKASRRLLIKSETELLQKISILDNKDYTALLFGEIMAKSNLDFIDLRGKINTLQFVDSCVGTITGSENFLLLNDTVFRKLEKLGSSNIKEIFDFFDGKTKPDSVFFSTLGRASKAISSAVADLLEEGKYEQLHVIFEKFHRYCSNLSIKWQECSFSSAETDKDSEMLTKKIWKYFQVVLFSYLVIVEPFANNIKRRFLKQGRVEPKVILPTINSILVNMQNLNFIIARFGSGGLPQFESQYAVLVSAILKISTIPAFKSQNRQTLESMFDNIYSVEIGTYCLISGTNPTLLSRQAFYLQTCGKFMDFIEDDYMHKILEFAKPRLIPASTPKSTATLSENEIALLDLTEAAHSVILDLFSTSTLHQKIVSDFTIPYIELLLTNLKYLDYDLVKDSFKRVVRGLCDFSGIYDHPIQKKRSLLVIEDDSFKFNIIEEPDYEFKAHVDDLAHELWAKTATELAWKSILLLADYIKEPLKISPKETTKTSSKPVDNLLNFNSEMIASVNQNQLLGILFEQISAISLTKLPELLELIRKLMIYGIKMGGEQEGFGVSLDIANSVVWNNLFDAISDHSRVDYTRRYDVAVWYSALYKEAISIRPKLKKSNQTNEIKARLPAIGLNIQRQRFINVQNAFYSTKDNSNDLFQQALNEQKKREEEQQKPPEKEEAKESDSGEDLDAKTKSGAGWAIGLGILSSYLYLGFAHESEDVEGENFFQAHNRRAMESIKESYDYFMNPPKKKLLPPLPPQLARDYTICVELTDALTHLAWDRDLGWRIAIRPGAKQLLFMLTQFFEVVVYTNTPHHLGTPVVDAIDNFGMVHYRLFREHHRLQGDVHLKDLEFLNRDLSKVIVLDIDPKALATHPDNGLLLKRWEGEKGDDELFKYADSLHEMLMFMETNKIKDIRPLLKTIKQYDEKDFPKAWKMHKDHLRSIANNIYGGSSTSSSFEQIGSVLKSLVGMNGGALSSSQQKTDEIGAFSVNQIESYSAHVKKILGKEYEKQLKNLEKHRKEQEEMIQKQLDEMKKSDYKLIDHIMGNVPQPGQNQ
ncbi:mitochondrial inner membrane protein required for protein import [Terramyces sp. JEL0728]|nr:mitochondrial inner membrane protein required for protein import [Terramyces sp. JEL0728]